MQSKRWSGRRDLPSCLLGLMCLVGAGCAAHDASGPSEAPIPRELRMTTLPPYVIEPSDILIITTLSVVPKPPYKVQPLDALYIQVTNTFEGKPISGAFGVEPDGRVNLGIDYGTVNVVGKTLEEAQAAIQAYLAKNILKNPRVQVSLAQSRGKQQIQGDHIVRMDGTIGLGVYGSVYVAGLTLEQARRVVEEYLGQYLLAPEISLDVYSYNSKWYYLIYDRAGYGQTVVRLPITGRDTVLDAVSMMFGTMFMSSNKHVWLARPNGKDPNDMQMFPVNWPALTQGGSPATNYQLMPGDRLYVQSNPLLMANNRLNQFFSPIERVLGFTLLGSSTVSSVDATILQLKTGTVTGFGGTGGFR